MIQTIEEMIVGGVIVLVALVILFFITKRAEDAGHRIEDDVTRLPLPAPEEIDDAHRSMVLQLKQKWKLPAFLSGFCSSNELAFYMAIPIWYLVYDIIPVFLVSLFLTFLLFFTGGLVAGIVRIRRKGDFWENEMNPILGIEANLERFTQKQLKAKPKDISGQPFYPEVESSIRANWELSFQSAVKQEILHAIYLRGLSAEDRQMLLEYFARRDDIIGQKAQEIQRDIAIRESASDSF